MSANGPYTHDKDIHFALRLPVPLLETVRELAQAERRPTGKQITVMLEQWPKVHSEK